MLLAIGMSLIFGVARIINLAHTGFFMVSAYLLWFFSAPVGISLPVAAILSVLITTLLGLGTYWFLMKPIKEHAFGGVAMIIITVAIGICMREVARIFPARDQYFVSSYIAGKISPMGITIHYSELLIIVLAPLIVFLVWIAINKTEFGISIQATSQDAEVANLMGVNTEKTNMMVMGLSVLLAAVAAILIIPTGRAIRPGLWETWLFPVMAVVVLGGFGSLRGGIIAAVILGAVLGSIEFLFPDLIFLKRVAALLTLVSVLVIRPGGIAGVPLEEF